MKKISYYLLICGIVLFVVGIILSMFPPITIDITIDIDEFSDFPIGMWLSPILMGSGLCISGIAVVYDFMTRKNL